MSLKTQPKTEEPDGDGDGEPCQPMVKRQKYEETPVKDEDDVVPPLWSPTLAMMPGNTNFLQQILEYVDGFETASVGMHPCDHMLTKLLVDDAQRSRLHSSMTAFYRAFSDKIGQLMPEDGDRVVPSQQSSDGFAGTLVHGVMIVLLG